MKFTQDTPGNELVFSDYDDVSVTINEHKLVDSLIVFPDVLHENWTGRAVDELSINDFELVQKRRPDIVILGTGRKQQFPSIALRRQLAASQLQLEIMDTAAACRTYNLLVSEDRDVAAAILMAKT